MNVLKLSISLQDAALAGALAKAIAKEYSYVEVAIGETDDADFTIRDEFLAVPAPVREIMDRVFALCGKDLTSVKRPDSCPFVAFTAGGGGRGVSTCACLYASLRAEDADGEILLLSLDPYCETTDPNAGMSLLRKVTEGSRIPLKAACVRHDRGFYRLAQHSNVNLLHRLTLEDVAVFLHEIEDSGEWAEVVLDVPRAYAHWRELMNMCETQIVVFSQDASLAQFDEEAFSELQESVPDLSAPKHMRFAPNHDLALNEGDADLYGQLGCEVKALAQQLAAH